MTSRRPGLVAAIVGTVLALSGAVLIAVVLASQHHAPQPPLSAAGPPASTGPRPEAVQLSLPRSKPTAIDIPSIGVHSPLQFLGLNADGTLEVPSGALFDVAGWYRYSPTPGSIGPAVILGHIDSGNYGSSVFFKLGDLKPGDIVKVGRRDGTQADFQVTGVREFPKDRFPTKLVYGDTKNASLRLITCGGAFDSSTGHYVDNIIVFASLVGSA
jgi:sortase (surface protein transpeptidase)